MSRRKFQPPFEVEVERLMPRGVGEADSPIGAVRLRGAPPGSRVLAVPFQRKKGVWSARRAAMVRPAPDHVEPRCAIFGLCGGCVLQELELRAQRAAKVELALRLIGPTDATVHPARGADAAYGYRNKVELSFGVRRYVSEDDKLAGAGIDGRFLGFHAPGRFDRVVDAERCELISEASNALLTAVRSVALRPDAPPPYDVRSHQGFWRHLLLREGMATGEHLVAIHTSSQGPREPVAEAAAAVLAVVLPEGHRVAGVVWVVDDSLADAALGEPREVWGEASFRERLGELELRLSRTAFFQTCTAGAEVLYDTIGEAVGTGGALLDLYCGAGSIGLYLSRRVEQVHGVEVVPEAVKDAIANAERNGITAQFTVGAVEDTLHAVRGGQGVRIVVDPPRPGLHPKVAKLLARTAADVLVYVACNPASLGRDAALLAEGGWRLTDLWPVDLFPQTGHVEVVGRLVRTDAAAAR